MGMTERAGGDAHAEIEVFTTLVVPDASALAAGHDEEKSAIGREDVLFVFFNSYHESEWD